jgi:hypothetical protein
MKSMARIFIAMLVFLTGVILVPAMGLPTEGFNWQRYAGVYDETSLTINHDSGAPGSFFTVLGTNFSPESMVGVFANGVFLGELETTESGDLLFLIDSTAAEDGYYLLEVIGSESAQTRVLIRADDTLWPQEDEGPVFLLAQPDIAPYYLIFMPVIEQ